METVQLMLKRAGKIAGMFTAGLEFTDGTPFVLLDSPDGGPVHRVQLDSRLLTHLGPGMPSYSYEVPVEDPRSLS
ncbi:hypothetical protein GUL16_02705 [Stenotrophomonas maltophilia]|uniref:hypothetical protein n=1 Tax=Stenotrophomonas pavanii TaxID=487698 RepID=UPI001F3AEB23|nr:hypothetical protein [Stenotrophomonas maltophilia]